MLFTFESTVLLIFGGPLDNMSFVLALLCASRVAIELSGQSAVAVIHVSTNETWEVRTCEYITCVVTSFDSLMQ